jgi:hypothetical protein
MGSPSYQPNSRYPGTFIFSSYLRCAATYCAHRNILKSYFTYTPSASILVARYRSIISSNQDALFARCNLILLRNLPICSSWLDQITIHRYPQLYHLLIYDTLFNFVESCRPPSFLFSRVPLVPTDICGWSLSLFLFLFSGTRELEYGSMIPRDNWDNWDRRSPVLSLFF